MSQEPPFHPPPEPAAGPADLDYEVVRLIGRGGYGEVWLVRERTGGYRACKVIYRESFDQDRPYEREYAGIQKFEPVSRANESQLQILHVGRREAAGYFYYILELADDVTSGREIDPPRYEPRTLRTELKHRGCLPLHECLQIGLALSAAVEHLHRHGLMHRDIKPANIIFIHGIPKLADIGLVTDLAVSISYVGTEGYIPPEGPTSVQADIYSLGKVLYEISTGKDRLEFPELPTELGEGAERQALLEFNAVVTKACQNEPSKRYRSAQELHADLALLQRGGSVRAQRAARKRRVWLAQGLALLTVLGLGFAALSYWRRPEPPREAAAAVPAPEKVPRLPVPAAERVARSEQALREKARPELAGASPERKARYAAELLRQSATSSDPAQELATLRVAAALAQEAEDYALALAACTKMGERFQLEPLPVKLELLGKSPLPAQTAKGATSLAEACVATGFEAIGQDDYERAQAAAKRAQAAAASTTAQAQLLWQTQFLDEELRRCGGAYTQLQALVAARREPPGSAAANFAKGELLCFVKNDWEAGLPLMAHGNEEQLKAVLDLEINHKPLLSREHLAAGDLWWQLAAATTKPRKSEFQRRARYWYLRGIARARGPEKPTLKQQLAERLQAVVPPAAEVHIRVRASGTEHIVLSADGVRWSSSRGSLDGRINHWAVGDFKGPGTRALRNCGATRLWPEDVDFSTARLTVNHALRRRAHANLELGEDHVRVALAGPRPGLSDFDVTVTFGPPP